VIIPRRRPGLEQLLSPLDAPSDSVTRPLALPLLSSSSSIPPPHPRRHPVRARAAVVVLLHTLAHHARPRPTAPAPQPSTRPRCLLPSSQNTGIWRRQRPGFAFSQVSTGARHAIGHQAACPRTLSPVCPLLQRPPRSMCRESTFLAPPKCPTPERARSFVRRCEALHTVAFHTCLFVYFIISHGRRQADTKGVRSRRQCCLRLSIMAPFGDQRLRRNARLEEWLRLRVAVRHLVQVSYLTSYSPSDQC